MDQCYSSMLQLSFIYKVKENASSRHADPKDVKRREAPGPAVATLFTEFLLPGPALCKLGYPGGLSVLPEVLTPGLRPSFVLFLQAFPFLVF